MVTMFKRVGSSVYPREVSRTTAKRVYLPSVTSSTGETCEWRADSWGEYHDSPVEAYRAAVNCAANNVERLRRELASAEKELASVETLLNRERAKAGEA